MASIGKITEKNGASYKITISGGRDINGKQVLTGMPERQIEKERVFSPD